MSRILPVDPNQTDTTTANTLAAVKTKLGVVPNLFTVFAQSPASLDGYLKLSEAVTKGGLTAKQRELISIAVAQENACTYCLSAHAAIGKGVGLGDTEISGARNGESLNLTDAAIIEFSLQVVRAKGGISDVDVEAIRKVIDNDGIIIEIVTNVVLNIMTNYVNKVAETDIDFPEVDSGSA